MIRPAFVLTLLFTVSPIASAQQLNQEAVNAAKTQAYSQRSWSEQSVLNQLNQLLYNKDLQQEVGFEEVQIEELRRHYLAYQKKLQEFYAEHREYRSEVNELYRIGKHELSREMMDKLNEKRGDLTKQLLKAADAILSSKQMDRIKQISRQQHARRYNPYGDEFGIVLTLSKELDLTDEERRRLIETIDETREKYYQKVAKLKREAGEEILNALPKHKREKFKKTLGETYHTDEKRRLAQNEARKRQRELQERQRALEQAAKDREAEQEKE